MTRAVGGRQESDFNQRLVARLYALAREHREGRLSLEAYRKLRAPLLDCLDSHTAADLQSTTLPNHQVRLREAGELAAAATLRASAAAPKRRSGLLRALALLAATGLLLAAGIALWWAHERAAAGSNRHTGSPCKECPFS